jgi:hypothetical protein
MSYQAKTTSTVLLNMTDLIKRSYYSSSKPQTKYIYRPGLHEEPARDSAESSHSTTSTPCRRALHPLIRAQPQGLHLGSSSSGQREVSNLSRKDRAIPTPSSWQLLEDRLTHFLRSTEGVLITFPEGASGQVDSRRKRHAISQKNQRDRLKAALEQMARVLHAGGVGSGPRGLSGTKVRVF